MKEIAELLRQKGLKVTPQRIAIFICCNATEHPSAGNHL